MALFDRKFGFHVDEFRYTDLQGIVSEVKKISFKLSLYFIVSDSAKIDNSRSEKGGGVEGGGGVIWLKLVFNKFSKLENILINCCFKIQDIKEFDICRKTRRKLRFVLKKDLCVKIQKIAEFLIQNSNDDVFRNIFEDFKPKIDNNDQYFKYINNNFIYSCK